MLYIDITPLIDEKWIDSKQSISFIIIAKPFNKGLHPTLKDKKTEAPGDSKRIGEDHAAGQWLRGHWSHISVSISRVWCPSEFIVHLYWLHPAPFGFEPTGPYSHKGHRNEVGVSAPTLRKLTVWLRGSRSSLLHPKQASPLILSLFFFPGLSSVCGF